MVRIEEITTVRSMVSLRLDNGTLFWMKRKELQGLDLYPGMEVDEEELYRFVKQCQYPRALNQAVAMLAGRPCSKGEIARRLQAGRYWDEVITLVLYKLEKERLLDDEAFSEQWARYRSEKYGPRRILQELRNKGIPKDMAEAAVGQLDEEDEQQHAVTLAAKYWRNAKAGEPEPRTRQKIITALVRRGYSWDTAREACAQAEKERQSE